MRYGFLDWQADRSCDFRFVEAIHMMIHKLQAAKFASPLYAFCANPKLADGFSLA